MLVLFTLPARAGFIGNTVHAEYLFPDTSSVFMDLGDASVGAGPEFSFSFDSDITVDFSDTNIAITILNGNSSFNAASFNGFHFFDVFAAIDPITNVALTSTNNFSFNASGITFDADNIFLDFQGLDVLPDSSLALAVTFASGPGPTGLPEPVSPVLIGLGMASLALVRRKA